MRYFGLKMFTNGSFNEIIGHVEVISCSKSNRQIKKVVWYTVFETTLRSQRCISFRKKSEESKNG